MDLENKKLKSYKIFEYQQNKHIIGFKKFWTSSIDRNISFGSETRKLHINSLLATELGST